MVPGAQFSERPEMAAFDAVAALQAYGSQAKAGGFPQADNPYQDAWAVRAWDTGWSA
jgi:hypothetical protein